jgi:hypothetical protein
VCNIEKSDVFNRISIEFMKDPAAALAGEGSAA